MKSFYDHTVKTASGETFDFATLAGKKVLVINTASECGLTPQYSLLQELYEEFGGETFEIIAFPSNDFGAQEPGSDGEILDFCALNYGVTFPIMRKSKVTGKGTNPVFLWLTEERLNGKGDYEVKWNFHKFFINPDGKLVKVLDPEVPPTDEWILNWLES
jgi:glutathione peroxidase